MIVVWLFSENGGELQRLTFAGSGQETECTEMIALNSGGVSYQEGALEAACRFLETVRLEANGVLLSSAPQSPAEGTKAGRQGKAENQGAPGAGRLVRTDEARAVLGLPPHMKGAVLLADALREDLKRRGMETETARLCAYAAGLDDLDICRLLAAGSRVAYLPLARCFGGQELREEGFCLDWLNPDWYLQLALRCLEALREFPEGEAPLLLQAQVVFRLKTVFFANQGNRNKGALAGEQRQRFFQICGECLRLVSTALLTAEDRGHKERRILAGVWSALMELRCGSGGAWEIRRADATCGKEQGGGLPEEDPLLVFAGTTGRGRKDGFLPEVRLDLMEYRQGVWRLDCSTEQFATEHLALEARKNGKRIPMRRTNRFSGESFFGEPVGQRDTFVLELPAAESDGQERLEFYLFDGRTELLLPVDTIDYQARLTKLLCASYWCFGSSMVTLCREASKPGNPAGAAQYAGKATGICRRKAGRRARMAQELSLLREILCRPYGSKRMFAVRLAYWMTLPFFSRKNIWLTFDKLYKGGDCGEYFFKYMENRREKGITPGYVIKKSSPDYGRLRAEGLRPLAYRSLRQRLMYLNASVIFATHSSVHSFCGFTRWEVRFIQDRLRAVNTCIQHGLSVQYLAADSNRIINNNRRYYCASPAEIRNLSKPEYDYGPDVLRLTGIPRYDGLRDRSRKQILITPTWRSYLAVPAVLGTARPYNPEFRHTEYFRIYQGLMENARLRRAAKQYGYRIVYLLHPVLSAQKCDFTVPEGITVLSATQSSYETLLTESDLMVTDYSGVQFDFAYMRKPVVYFHPPELPPHYEEGGFSCEKDGFGEICTQTEELVETLCGYMEAGCALKEAYREREDAFFAFSDQESCRRIFEDALELQRELIQAGATSRR